MTADAEVLAKVHRLWTRYAAAIWVQTGATIAIYAWMAVYHWRSIGGYLARAIVVGMLALFAELNAKRPYVWLASVMRGGILLWFVGMAALAKANLSGRPASHR